MVIDDTSLCFINCHLSAGQEHVRARGKDAAIILGPTERFPASETNKAAMSMINGGDGTYILDHEIIIVSCIIPPPMIT
jgi:hypothetical protein